MTILTYVADIFFHLERGLCAYKQAFVLEIAVLLPMPSSSCFFSSQCPVAPPSESHWNGHSLLEGSLPHTHFFNPPLPPGSFSTRCQQETRDWPAPVPDWRCRIIPQVRCLWPSYYAHDFRGAVGKRWKQQGPWGSAGLALILRCATFYLGDLE